MERKVEKYLKTSFELAIEQVKNHYIISPFGNAVNTSGPFLKAVDPLQFPDYATIIHEPMDLSKITKNIKNNKYSIAETDSASTAILSVLRDIDLIRNNAHTYNSSPESADIRIMADALRNYFRYLLRICLKIFQRLSEPALVSYMLHLPEVDDYLDEKGTKDVATFLEVSNTRIEDLIDKSGLLRQLGIKSLNSEMRDLIQELSAIHIPSEAPVIGKAMKGKALKGPSISLEIPKATSSKGSKRSISTMLTDDLIDTPTSAPTPTANARSKPGPLKRRKSNALDEGFDAPMPSITLPTYTEDEGDLVLFQSSAGPPSLNRTASSNAIKVARLPWIEAADSVLKAIGHHPYVDPKKSTVAADFYHPVTEINPNIAEDYNRVISRPMDLSTIRIRLDAGSILDGQEFYEMLLSVFQNAVDYNASHTESQYAMKLVDQCLHLVKYCSWLCLEYLPLEDDVNHAEPEQLGDLRITLRDKARKEREEIVMSAYISEIINNPYSECKKLIKDVERTSKKQELVQLGYFIHPVDVSLVTDYLAFIRHPIDLSTIKYRLDGTEPSLSVIAQAINKHSPRYSRFSEFVTDLRKVFTNAQHYNKQHLETDTTQTSRAVYEAAIAFEEKLEGLMPKFTLNLADRVVCARVIMKENQQIEEERRKKKLLDDEETKILEEKMIEDYKKTDKMFAADFDIELKKKQTEKQLKAQLEAKKLAALQADGIMKAAAADDVLADDLSSPNLSPEMSPAITDKPLDFANVPSLVYGFGVAGTVPKPFQYLLDAKVVLRRKAWDFFNSESTNVKATNAPVK